VHKFDTKLLTPITFHSCIFLPVSALDKSRFSASVILLLLFLIPACNPMEGKRDLIGFPPPPKTTLLGDRSTAFATSKDDPLTMRFKLKTLIVPSLFRLYRFLGVDVLDRPRPDVFFFSFFFFGRPNESLTGVLTGSLAFLIKTRNVCVLPPISFFYSLLAGASLRSAPFLCLIAERLDENPFRPFLPLMGVPLLDLRPSPRFFSVLRAARSAPVPTPFFPDLFHASGHYV